MSTNTQVRPAFGTVLADQMAIATYRNGQWGPHEIRPTGPIEIHPAAHVLHYASECFEGFKAYRWADGSIHVFRMDKHIERMRQSARLLALPVPDAAQLATMILTVIDRVRPEMMVVKEETFGPVSPIVTFANIDEAIRISNGTAYGLSSSVCTNRMDYITRFVSELNVGTVNVREVPGYRLELTPFGGIKDSGLGYKEGVQEAMKSFTNVKTYSLPWL
jgi:hypothetical protein